MQWQKNWDNFELLLERQMAETGLLKTREFMTLKREQRKTSAVIHSDPADLVTKIEERTERHDIKSKRGQEQDNCMLKHWLKMAILRIIIMQAANWRNNKKKLDRLLIENDILYRKFFDEIGTYKEYYLSVTQLFCREFVYCIPNSKTQGHAGVTRTAH